jgi:Bacterial CdiA-CT RNAse A domain
VRSEAGRLLGATGVVSESGFKACLPLATPAPILSLAAVDRIERTAGVFDSIDLRAIEGRDGHTLRRHVGRSDQELRDRALRTHHDVSCFDDGATAQHSVDEAFAENQTRIGSWLAAHRRGNLALHVHFASAVGRVFRYDEGRIVPATDADVILEPRPQLPQGYTVITAFPT